MVDREEIDLDKSMIDEGIIDSIGLIEIAAFMEKEFRMKINEEQMIRDNFGSVNKIIDFIRRVTDPSNLSLENECLNNHDQVGLLQR